MLLRLGAEARDGAAREPRASRAEAWPGHGVMVETLPWRRLMESLRGVGDSTQQGSRGSEGRVS